MLSSTTTLAFSMYSSPGIYAVLLGSGVSRAAGIPTGWEIVLDLCRKIAQAESEDPGQHPDQWYQQKYGSEPRYDELKEQISRTPDERQALLNQYFVPTEEDQAEGKKKNNLQNIQVTWKYCLLA
ncbi:hypothetical protein SAMN04487897_11278 [Paenibacillus sp. yr247]|uniref:hypothetical protein n=1 Tax=Paenibacillus sp. yr247 TaxID=1761880 RepID=UPI000882BB05|nr:hypothetical protein [Paenibacillus sp. yr247]SDO34482.1 hypothetical protein SAMN04487897_11278 [Paenibacillus sp. yr247]